MRDVKPVDGQGLTQRGLGYEPEGKGVSDSPRPGRHRCTPYTVIVGVIIFLK